MPKKANTHVSDCNFIRFEYVRRFLSVMGTDGAAPSRLETDRLTDKGQPCATEFLNPGRRNKNESSRVAVSIYYFV